MGKDKKTCIKCGETKEITEYHKSPRTAGGYNNTCKVCRAAIRKARRASNVEYERKRHREYYKRNKEKIQARKCAWREKNKDKIREKNKKYREGNKDKLKKYFQEYYKRPEVRSRINKKDTERRHNDPAYRIKKIVSTQIYTALKGNRKSRSTFDALPYTPEQLKEHLESQFEDWMNWDNYGEWHVDHIHPQSLLPYDSMDHPNFQKCWALENLQPLEARENILKSNKILDQFL